MSLRDSLWPRERAGEALAELARAAGLVQGDGSGATDASSHRLPPEADESVVRSVLVEARRLGVDAEAVETSYDEAEALLRAGPALLRLPASAEEEANGGGSLLAVLPPRLGRARLLGPDGRTRSVRLGELAARLRAPLDAAARPGVERVLARLGDRAEKADRVRRHLLARRLGKRALPVAWLLRLGAGAPLAAQAREAGLPMLLGRFLLYYSAGYTLLLGSWWALGRGALAGRLAPGWLWLWGLLLATLLWVRPASVWMEARLAAGVGMLLKRRLLHGALRLAPEDIRHQGAGQLLGRVLESEAVEASALRGGFLSIAGGIEVFFSLFVLAAGAGAWLQVPALLLWGAVLAGLGRHYYVCRRAWTERRLQLTHAQVENLVGYRTRRVQQEPERLHGDDDTALEAYAGAARRLDRAGAWLSLTARGWLLVGFAALAPALASAAARSEGTDAVAAASLALGVGGVLTAFRGFGKLSEGFDHLAATLISWRQAAPVIRAGNEGPGEAPEVQGWPLPAPAPPSSSASSSGSPHLAATDDRPLPETLLEARDLTFHHQGRARPVLSGLDLTLRRGDRLVLEGPSGGGKSTLAAVLSGLRKPSSGLLLYRGLDRPTLGEQNWRRSIVAAPQFHENHVFAETLAFNLLMGRRWPPEPGDLEEAVAVCRELGLGPLLEAMPAGLQQMVGESGWQLSHGEASRLFMARALLQGAEVVILDESLAALDAASLERAIACAERRAPALMVIAHP